jgi:hypothetical protein
MRASYVMGGKISFNVAKSRQRVETRLGSKTKWTQIQCDGMGMTLGFFLFVYSCKSNFSAIWQLSLLPVTGLQIQTYA